MKKLVVIVGLLVLGIYEMRPLAQSNVQEHSVVYENGRYAVSELTLQRMFDEYSVFDVEKFVQDRWKSKVLDYYYSASFQVKPGQNFTKEQYLKISIGDFDELRMETEVVEIYDPRSGLYLLLDSIDLMRQKLGDDFMDDEVEATTSRYSN